MAFHTLPQSSFSRTTATRVVVHHTLLSLYKGRVWNTVTCPSLESVETFRRGKTRGGMAADDSLVIKNRFCGQRW